MKKMGAFTGQGKGSASTPVQACESRTGCGRWLMRGQRERVAVVLRKRGVLACYPALAPPEKTFVASFCRKLMSTTVYDKSLRQRPPQSGMNAATCHRLTAPEHLPPCTRTDHLPHADVGPVLPLPCCPATPSDRALAAVSTRPWLGTLLFCRNAGSCSHQRGEHKGQQGHRHRGTEEEGHVS